MDRRTFLAGTIFTLTGCLQTSSSSTPGTPTKTPVSTADTPVGDNDNRPTATSACPQLNTSTDRMVCSPPQPADASVWLSVAHPTWNVDTTDNTVATNVFTLHNDSETSLKFNPYNWELHKQTDTGWSGNLRQTIGDGFVIVAPDERYRWSFSLVPHPSPNSKNTEYITVNEGNFTFNGGINEGKYAFFIGVPAPTDKGEWITCLATFVLKFA
jgi:hypothetical protein